jgi:hypothetical protein
MRLGVTLDILNQKDTPAFYADTLANRPAAGFTGRIFVSTDTLDLYRDTGTTWVLLSPSSTGTITGSGAAGQVTYFSGTSSITGSNDLFFDSVNGHLGIGTITPSTALTIFHDQNQIIQINQTTATNDTKIAFQNSGTPLWRIGNSYNAGANDYAIYDVVGAIQPLTIKKTSGQTFIGTQTTSSGLLVVNSSTGDNQIVAIGATAPSIRVRNAGTSPSRQFGLGLATASNNFIQGTTGGEFCIFNASTTASPILFGIFNSGTGFVEEDARISAAGNLLINTTTDAGQRLQVNGTSLFSSNLTISGSSIGSTILNLAPSTNTDYTFITYSTANGTAYIGTDNSAGAVFGQGAYAMNFYNSGSAPINFSTSATNRMRISGSTGNILIGTTTDVGYKLQVNGYIYTNQSLLIANTNIQYRLHTGNDGIELSAGVGGVYLDYGMTSWGSLSDERLKNIDSEILNATKSLMTLRTVRYSLKEDKRKKINLGLIAQDVIKVFPEAVDIQNNEIGTMGVRYTELIPVLVKAIQELNEKIENLK